jgi:hypothetical protein
MELSFDLPTLCRSVPDGSAPVSWDFDPEAFRRSELASSLTGVIEVLSMPPALCGCV